MFAIGFVVALLAAVADQYLERFKYRAHDHAGRVAAGGCFIGGCTLMVMSVVQLMWKYLP